MMYKSYYFIQKNRLRKKMDIYKLFFSISFDFTSTFYVMLIVAYSLFAFYQVGEIPSFIQQLLTLLTDMLNTTSHLVILFSFLPIYFMMQAWQRPGVLFSSAKFLLAILPYDRRRLWFLSLGNALVKTVVKLNLIAMLVYIITPLTLTRLAALVCITILFIFMMTIIQWKMYQLHIGVRILIITVASILSGTSVWTNNLFIFIVYSLFLSGLFVYALRNLFTRVDWSRVIAASDFAIWHMQLISHATKVKFKKDEQPSLWYRLPSWKAPFAYEKEFAYYRLWYIYGEKEISIIVRMTGALFLLLTVVSYFSYFYYSLFVAIVIYIQTSLLHSLFKDRLYTGLVNLLPWDLVRFRKTFIHWAILISILLLIPTGLYAVFYFEKIFIVYLIYIGASFYYILLVRLQKCVHDIDESHPYSPVYEAVSYALLLILILTSLYPALVLVGFLILAVMSKVIFSNRINAQL